MKIRTVAAELFHMNGWTQMDGQTERQTDVKKLIDACRNVVSAPNKNALALL